MAVARRTLDRFTIISDALFDLAATIGVGDQMNATGPMLEDEPFQNPVARVPRLRNRIQARRHSSPHLSLPKCYTGGIREQ
jgi:hypothetical protein